MFGSSNFSSQPTSFGGFNSPSATGNVFGQTAPVSSSSLFGSNSFNQPVKQTPFGASGTPAFGSPQNTTMFGQSPRINGTSSGMFSSSPAIVSPFSTATGQVQGTSIPFNATTSTDSMMKNGQTVQINTRHQCITCMKEYDNKCLEELRYEDYQLGRKGTSQPNMFGSTPTQQNSGLFSSIPNASTTNTFGQRTTAFGSSSPSGGLFPNMNQPKSNFFTPTTSSAFGTSSFSFSSPANQTTGIFGQSGGQTSVAGTLGTNTGFSFSQPAQQPTLGLFGQKPLTAPVSTAPPFSGFGLPQTTLNKPLPMFGSTPTTGFGSAPQPFGATPAPTSLFGSTAPTQPKPFSFTNFGTTPQPTFGSTGASNFSFNNPASTANLGFTSTATPSFGTNTSTGFGSFGTNTFSLGNSTNTTGFGATPFSFNNPSSLSSGFSFLNPGATNQLGQMSVQQPTPPTGPVPFATTPYKDSPLFYNLITNRSLDDMTKPTNPLAQRAIKEASRRRTSSNFTSSAAANIKNLTFPVSKNQIFNKKNFIFDGFEEEDRGNNVHILAPQSSVKMLSIKGFHTSNRPSIPSPFSASISKATSATLPNLNESGPFEIGDYQGGNTSRTYGGSFNQVQSSALDESNATLDDYSNNTGHSTTDFNRYVFHVPSLDQSSFNESQSREQQENSRTAQDGNNSGGGVRSNSCGVTSTRPGYFVHPSVAELDKMTTDSGACFIRGLVIGRHNYGQIRFLDVVNVAGINLDEIFLFRHKEVSVYPDDDNKPPVGQGLNCPAEIRMNRVWPLDRDTRDPIKSPYKIRSLNYEDKLKRSCKRMSAEFVSYDHDNGIWVFRVHHFSKYSCVPEETEEDDLENLPPVLGTEIKGLGGITAHDLKSGVLLSPPQPQTSQQQSHGLDLNVSGEVGSILKPKSWTTNYHSTPMLHTKLTLPKGRTRERMQMSDRDYYMATGDNEVDMEDGDVDYNPLTPSEYDSDSDKECGDGLAGPSRHSLYGSIIRDTIVSPTPKVSVMKSILAREFNPPDVDEASARASPPPQKKSRPPRSSISDRRKIRFSEIRRDEQTENMRAMPGYRGYTEGLSMSMTIDTDQQRIESEPSSLLPQLPLRQYSKREEVRKSEDVVNPPLPMFSDMMLNSDCMSSQRRGSRVCFGPGGHFIQIQSGPNKVGNQVQLVHLESHASQIDKRRPTFYKRAVECQLDYQLQCQGDVALTGDVLTVEPGGNVVSQIEFLESFLQQHHHDYSVEHFMLLKEERQVWSLCKILWPQNTSQVQLTDPEFLATQREKLVRWFEINCQMLFGDLYNTTDNSTRGFLMRGMRLEACEQSICEEDLNLALCLSQDSADIQATCKYQVTQWDVEGATEFIHAPEKTLYELCAGHAIWENVDFHNMTTSDWLQHFAIYLWYIAPAHETIQEIITRYQCLVVASAGTNSEELSFPQQADSSLANLCINLLKTFAFVGYPLKNLLNPSTNNPDCLDYKLSWLLTLNLEQFGGYKLETELKENIAYGFAGQLEKMGFFEWAVYVVKHLQPSKNRDIVIRRILERNLNSQENQIVELFLLESLRVDSQEIFAAKTLRDSRAGRRYHLMWYLLKSKKYDEAFNILARNICDIHLTPDNVLSWDALLEEMHAIKRRIYDWEKHGQCIHSLFSAIKLINNELIQKHNSFVRSEIQAYVIDMFSALARIQPNNSSEVMFLLEVCSSVKCIAEVLIDDVVDDANSDYKYRFPTTELLNTKYMGEYIEEVRIFFNELHNLNLQIP